MASLERLTGRVPQHPERSNRNAVATATTSRTLIPDMYLTLRRLAAARPTTDELSGTALKEFRPSPIVRPVRMIECIQNLMGSRRHLSSSHQFVV